MSKKNVKILVCCHKRDVMATQEPYMPIQVGKALATVDLGIQGDDTGDNISAKNRSYCELTGMYWAWKNLKNVDIIGLCHYRRYFDFHGQCRRFRPFDVFPTSKFDSLDLSIPSSAIDNFKDGMAIVNKPWSSMNNLHFDYCYYHFSDDFNTLMKIIRDSQEERMRRAFYHIMFCSHTFAPANMFIMTWHDFEEYCNFLFSVLSQVEREIDITHYNSYQRRIYGFMSERLLNVWLYARQIKLDYHPMIWVTDQGIEVPSIHSYYKGRIRGWINTKVAHPRTHDLKGMQILERDR